MNENRGLIGHWPFTQDVRDHSTSELMTVNHGVEPGITVAGRTGARFNGLDAYLEVENHPALQSGRGDFSCAGWVYVDETFGDVVGDILSKWDPDTRTGWQLSLVTNGGVTSTTQSNYRQLCFGTDAGRLDPAWTHCGRPGNAVLISALRVSNGRLYAGTLETGVNEQGHVWRYESDGKWTDFGNPSGCNLVHSITEYDDDLYCGVGRYNCAGSALGETLNQTPGGMVYRLDADGAWIYCGHPGAEDAVPEETLVEGYETGKADDVLSLTVYEGRLYCASNHRRGAFVYEGDERWSYIGPHERILSFTVYHGRLYALINGGPVYRYEVGTDWTFCGHPEGSTQTYSTVTCAGELYVGTWPEGEIFRYQGGEAWHNIGRVGFEREIMGMVSYNGKVYIGSLPMANVWRMDGHDYAFVGSLDTTPAPLRRVWTMAVYQGRLFAGTLPSGRVWSIQAGQMATWDQTFPVGWHHVAAIREGGILSLYVDSNRVAASAEPDTETDDISTRHPLRIGFGAYDYLNGILSDIRLYNRALQPHEVQSLGGV